MLEVSSEPEQDPQLHYELSHVSTWIVMKLTFVLETLNGY